MSKITCSCNEYPWRFYKAGESATNAHGDTSQPFLCDVWERVDDDLCLCTSQFALGEEGRFYCDRCGTLCTAKGTTEPQVPWARVVQAEKRMEMVVCERDQAQKNVVALQQDVLSQGIAVNRLADELAAKHEVCPFETEEGCPRPDENYNLDHNHSCDKGDRRSRRGAECWRLWAMAKRVLTIQTTEVEA